MTEDQPPEALELLRRIAKTRGNADEGAVVRTEPLIRPAPNPCDTCPFRRDVPSGLWAAHEYEKLRAYDQPTGEQPTAMFQCHQTTRDNPRSRVCAGWAGIYRRPRRGFELLAYRMAEAFSSMRADDLYATLTYRTKVPLFASGNEAADHGLAEIDDPGPAALAMQDKVAAKRPDARDADGRPFRRGGRALFEESDEDDEEDDNLIWPQGEGPDKQ